MSFFKKLKEKLFKSSSKLNDDLEAIVEEGAVEEVVEEVVEEQVAEEVAVEEVAVVEEQPEPTPEPEPEPTPEPEPIIESEPEPEPEPVVEPEPEPEPTPEPVIELEPEPTPEPVVEPEPEPTPEPVIEPEPEPTPEPEKKSLLGRVFKRATKKVGEKVTAKRTLDDAMLESLEDVLIAADMGVETAVRLCASIADSHFGKRLSTDQIKTLLADQIIAILEPVARPLPLYAKKPQVVLVVGVNGSGKTTTIGKLAAQFKSAGKSVLIAAGDTFRAAAVEQLQVWGQRAGVEVLTAAEGSDPAALAFDALARAEEKQVDLLMIDTAGRLQNRQDLMDELAKIMRVLRKKDADAPHNTLLVLDATTGQNALSQVEIFQKISDVSGLVMTKLDGTARGGILVALADKFALPIHAIGVGEQIDDLSAFEPKEFASALLGQGEQGNKNG